MNADSPRANRSKDHVTDRVKYQAANTDRVVVLGRVGGAFGVGGWVKVQSYTEPPGNLLQYPVWLLKSAQPSATQAQAWVSTRCLQGREVATGLQVQLDAVTTREQAAQLHGAEIGVRRSELPPLTPGEFYWDDIVGLEAYSIAGERLGRIEEIVATLAHPLLRIVERQMHEGASKGKPRESLVPLVRERVKAVDLLAGRITVDWQSDW